MVDDEPKPKRKMGEEGKEDEKIPVNLTKLCIEVEEVIDLIYPNPLSRGWREPAGCALSGPVIDENGHDSDND